VQRSCHPRSPLFKPCRRRWNEYRVPGRGIANERAEPWRISPRTISTQRSQQQCPLPYPSPLPLPSCCGGAARFAGISQSNKGRVLTGLVRGAIADRDPRSRRLRRRPAARGSTRTGSPLCRRRPGSSRRSRPFRTMSLRFTAPSRLPRRSRGAAGAFGSIGFSAGN